MSRVSGNKITYVTLQ